MSPRDPPAKQVNPDPTKAVGPGAAARRFAPLAIIVGGLVFAYAAGLHRHISLQAFIDSRTVLRDFVSDNLLEASAGFVVAYAILVAFAFPAAAIFTIAAGFLFGWFLGGTLTVIGATLGATALFLAARHAFGDVLRRRAGGSLARFADGFRDDAFSYLLVLRLTPVLPFVAVNIAPAFFDVKLRTYIVTTFLGIIPGSMVYAFLGSGINRALAKAGKGEVTLASLVTTDMTVALLGLGALAVLGLVLKKTFLKGRRHGASAPVKQGD